MEKEGFWPSFLTSWGNKKGCQEELECVEYRFLGEVLGAVALACELLSCWGKSLLSGLFCRGSPGLELKERKKTC